jgi:hypothetical protein
MRHKRFLPRGHKYRMKRMDKYFDNRDEAKSTAPSSRRAGKRVFQIVSKVTFVFGKKTRWKEKKGCKGIRMGHIQEDVNFFKYLPYWKDLDIRHAIDGMHIQKNVFDSLIGILLNINGKTKEGLNSRLDLVNLGIKKELTPIPQQNGKYLLLVASYNLNPEEKHEICVWLKTLKVSSGFCSNIKSLVSMNGLTLTNYNSHDCHVMLTTFLPIAIRAIKPMFVKMAITRLCYLFNKISQ